LNKKESKEFFIRELTMEFHHLAHLCDNYICFCKDKGPLY
jgi:hypothetical protein